MALQSWGPNKKARSIDGLFMLSLMCWTAPCIVSPYGPSFA